MPPRRRYHSHPVFAPKPSQKDAENQRNYQALFRCEASGVEPFLGAIVGPWDLQLPSPVSTRSPPWHAAITRCIWEVLLRASITMRSYCCSAAQESCMSWFVVRTRLGVLTPFHVRISQADRACLPDQAETVALHSLIDMVRGDTTRIDFSQPWRSFSCFEDGQPQGPALSKVACCLP